MYLATGIANWTTQWVWVEGENLVEGELEVAETEAEEVEMEVMEVACQAKEVVGMIKVVVPQEGKIFDQNAALSFPASVQVVSQKQVRKELQQHYREGYKA